MKVSELDDSPWTIKDILFHIWYIFYRKCIMPLKKGTHNPFNASYTREFSFPYALDTTKAKLVVMNCEAGKPHFHISVNGVILTSIRLDKPKYYFHRESYRYLSKEQLKALIRFLKGKAEYPDDGTETVWESLVRDWFNNNTYYKTRFRNRIMPDYRRLVVMDYNYKKMDNKKSIFHLLN